MYGPLIIGYLFLGGTAAGGFFAISAWSLAFPHTGRMRALAGSRGTEIRAVEAFSSLRTRMYVLCLTLLVIAVTFLFWDLGSPEKILLVLARPHATALTFGTACLGAQAIIGGLLAAGSIARVPFLQGRVRRVLEAICCIASLATMAYTGFFLMGNIGIAFWSTWAIVPLFVASALSCGITLTLLVDYFIKDQTILLRAARPLQKLHLACLAAEAVFAAFFVQAALSNPAAESAVSILFSADILPVATIGVLGFGIAAPAACEIYALSLQDSRTIPISDVLCLCGGLLLRYCIIACGVH